MIASAGGQLVWSLLWFVLFVGFVVAAIGSVVHFRVRVHAPIWATVIVGVLMFLLPYITLVLYWVVYGIYRLAIRNRGRTRRHATRLTPDAYRLARGGQLAECRKPVESSAEIWVDASRCRSDGAHGRRAQARIDHHVSCCARVGSDPADGICCHAARQDGEGWGKWGRSKDSRRGGRVAAW